MARPQSPEYDQRRQFILDKAAELFAGQGFHSASVAQIAEACESSKALIYHYFGSKEELLFATMEDHVLLLRETAQAGLEADGSAADRLRAVARDFLDIYRSAGAKHVVLLNELKSLEPTQRRRIVRLEREVIEIFETLIGEIGPAEIRDHDRLAVATRLFMGMINWTYTWYDAAGPVSSDTVANMATETFISGLERGDFGFLDEQEAALRCGGASG